MFIKSTEYHGFINPEWETKTKPIRAMLVQPPNIGGVRSLLSHMGEKGESIGFKPPLGLLYIATFIKERTCHDVQVLDAQAESLDLESCVSRIASYRPDVVGISAWTDWWYPAYTIGRLLRARMPNVHICYGGPHLGIYPEETLLVDFTDSVIAGDGEMPFACLCNMIGSNVKDNGFPGLHFKEFGVKDGDTRFFVQKDLDDLPIPDRTLLPLKNYTSVLSKSDFITTMITSRGCPFLCTFCKLNFQKTLCISSANVIDEFKKIQDLGIKEVEIYDDTFTWSKKRVEEICHGLIEQNNTVKWSIRDRVSSVEPHLLDLMKKAGCERIHYGVESGVDEVIEFMKKKITTDQASRAIRLARERGFTVLTYFMFGNIGETAEDMRKTVDFALELDANYVEFSVTIPYPGTEMYTEGIRKGIITKDHWKEFALNPSADYLIPQLYEENVTRDELVAIRNEAIQRYYFRWRYILKELLQVRRWSELKKKGKMGFRLLNSLNGKTA